MKAWHATWAVSLFAAVSVGWAAEGRHAGASPLLVAQGTQQDLKGMEQAGQRDDAQTMSTAQQAQYRAQYLAAKAQWAKMTPQQRSTTVAAARDKKLKDMSALELVGQRDDMQRETAAQSGKDKAQADAAKAKWDKLAPAEQEAVKKTAMQKKRADLSEMERVGQRD